MLGVIDWPSLPNPPPPKTKSRYSSERLIFTNWPLSLSPRDAWKNLWSHKSQGEEHLSLNILQFLSNWILHNPAKMSTLQSGFASFLTPILEYKSKQSNPPSGEQHKGSQTGPVALTTNYNPYHNAEKVSMCFSILSTQKANDQRDSAIQSTLSQ